MVSTVTLPLSPARLTACTATGASDATRAAYIRSAAARVMLAFCPVRSSSAYSSGVSARTRSEERSAITAQGKPPRTVSPARGTPRTVPGKGEVTAFPATVSVFIRVRLHRRDSRLHIGGGQRRGLSGFQRAERLPFFDRIPLAHETSVTTLLFSGTSDTVREGTTEPNTVTLL